MFELHLVLKTQEERVAAWDRAQEVHGLDGEGRAEHHLAAGLPVGGRVAGSRQAAASKRSTTICLVLPIAVPTRARRIPPLSRALLAPSTCQPLTPTITKPSSSMLDTRSRPKTAATAATAPDSLLACGFPVFR